MESVPLPRAPETADLSDRPTAAAEVDEPRLPRWAVDEEPGYTTTVPPYRAAQGTWRIAVVEDHLFHRKRTEDLVRSQPGLNVVWSGETLPEFTAWLDASPDQHRPHLLVLDLKVDRGPNVDPAIVRELTLSGIIVLVLSAMTSPELVRKILRAGIGGIVGKRDSEQDVIAAIWTVLGRGEWITPELASVIAYDAQRPRLSDQEERTLVLYASGMTLDSVAATLGVKKDTAKKYLSRVKAKYAAVGRPASTKLSLNAVAQQDGYLDPPSGEPRLPIARRGSSTSQLN